MSQVERNKAELWGLIVQYSGVPLTKSSMAALDRMMGAYKALCMVCGHEEEDGQGESPLTKQEAELWVSRMKNADGSVGAHWAMGQTEQFRTQRGIDCDPLKFWVSMNMMYSDYCKVAKKNNASTVDFFVDMAKAFLDDVDARPDKLVLYYRYVAES